MRLPDRVYTPGPWVPGTGGAGPVGPLVAVVGGQRKSWWGWEQGLAGVSVRTGEYRFLDLPGYSPSVEGNAAPALSADGRWLAYWIGGQGRFRRVVATGVAVYDTITGAVATHDLPSPQGATARGAAWAGDTVRFSHAVITRMREDGYSATAAAPLSWNASGGNLPDRPRPGKSAAAPRPRSRRPGAERVRRRRGPAQLGGVRTGRRAIHLQHRHHDRGCAAGLTRRTTGSRPSQA
jgi:hypothetical protein